MEPERVLVVVDTDATIETRLDDVAVVDEIVALLVGLRIVRCALECSARRNSIVFYEKSDGCDED